MKNPGILILILATLAPQYCQGQEELIQITNPRSHSPVEVDRLQIRQSGDSIQIWGFNLWSLPKKVRKITFRQPGGKINFASLRLNAASSLDKTFALLHDTSLGFKSKLPTVNIYRRLKEKFLHRKRTSPYFKNQWVFLGAVNGKATDELTFSTKGFFRNRVSYQTDFLPGGTAGKFPAIDPWNCVPADERFFKLRKLQGYGLDKIAYNPYESAKREIIRKQFVVYFPLNSIQPDLSGLQDVIDYLQRNHYEILSATMEGGCSIEGDSLKNHQLQVKRAKVLAKALRQYNNSPIRRDTVLLADTWSQFRELMSNSEWKDLDSMNNRALRNKINADPALRAALEPILTVQRKASLALSMAKVFTYDERLVKLESRLTEMCFLLGGQNDKTVEANIMGILDFLFHEYTDQGLPEAAIKEILDQTGRGDYLHTLLGYHLIKQFENGTGMRKGVPWNEYWNQNHLDQWFLKGQQHLINLASKTSDTRLLSKYKRMLADYQAYCYKFIQMGIMDINELCSIRYPDRPAFINLQLYQYGFLYEMSAQGRRISCMGISGPAKTYKKDSVADTDAFLEQLHKEIGIKNTMTLTANGNRITKTTWDTSPRSPYYVLLREKYVLGHDYVTDAFEYVDDGSPVELDAFNLMHLVMPNVSAWDPANRYFYDQKIQLNELDKLVSTLKKVDGSICDPQVNQLYLDYHLKALYYLDRYFEPGNEKQTKIVETSLRFISEYYKGRTKSINPALSMHILKQLNLFNWLPGAGTGASYGYDLLKTIAKERLLNDTELKLFAHYVRLFDPNFRNPLPSFYTKEQITRLGEEKFAQQLMTRMN